MTSQWQSCKLWESKTCDLSAPAISILLCSCSCLKTLLTQRALLTLQVHALFKLKFWMFPLITYFGYHVTEYCAVIGTHSTVRGDKLLYGHIPDPFPWCGIGSGHARLIPTLRLHKPRWCVYHPISNPIEPIITILLWKLESHHLCHCLEQRISRTKPQFSPRELLTNKRFIVPAESSEGHSLHAGQEDRTSVLDHSQRDLRLVGRPRCDTMRHHAPCHQALHS